MPGIYDTMSALKTATVQTDRERIGKELAEQVSHLQVAIQCSTSSLLSDP